MNRRTGNGRAAGSCVETPFVVCSVHAFRAQLRRERERVDRHGGLFSLVIVDLQGGDEKSRSCQGLLLRVQRLMRSLDLVGWLDSSRVGVLLPATSLQGAMSFTA